MADMETWMVANALGQTIGDERRNANEWIAYAGELESEVAELRRKLAASNRKLAVTEANRVGATVQAQVLLDALRAVQPNHLLLQPSGQTFRRGANAGRPKTHLRVVFERAFDQIAARLKLASPVSKWRED